MRHRVEKQTRIIEIMVINVKLILVCRELVENRAGVLVSDCTTIIVQTEPCCLLSFLEI